MSFPLTVGPMIFARSTVTIGAWLKLKANIKNADNDK